ncbi:MAG: C4-dicarboxylate anaerobic carrier [bacterium F082]|nr:MAG: C4-dicarboxylate anaerobic carrier [bacterium F082]
MKKRKVPHTFVIVFFIIVIAAVLTWIIPPGKYVTEQVNGETVMTFYYADQLPESGASTGSATAEFHAEPQTWQVFSAFYKGFVKQGNIIVFILIIGGAFWIMNKSKAIDMGIMSFLCRHHSYHAVVQPLRECVRHE